MFFLGQLLALRRRRHGDDVQVAIRRASVHCPQRHVHDGPLLVEGSAASTGRRRERGGIAATRAGVVRAPTCGFVVW
jgi:hypothetical protein